MEHLIDARRLSRHFPGVEAVRDISLQVASGQIYGLVGPDGAGKTTAMRLLCGAYQPTYVQGVETEIRICGYDLIKDTERARSKIGYLSQRFSLYQDLTVLENIRFFAEMRGLTAGEWLPSCMEILDFVGLAEYKDRRAGHLSGGMKQKLGLASALVTRPRVLLLDEPTTGVDPVTRQDFWQLIIRLTAEASADQGVCVLLSTPYMDEAARCHRIGFMRQGKIISEGSAGDLKMRLEGRVIALKGNPQGVLRAVAASDPQVEEVHAFGDRLHLRLKEASNQQVLERIQSALVQAGCVDFQVLKVPPSLEDVFISLAEAS